VTYQVVPFTGDHVEAAARLFADSYRVECRDNPLLPTRAADEPAWIAASLGEALANPGVAVFSDSNMLGYMCTVYQFDYRGVRAAACPEYAHASVLADKAFLYRLMYMELGAEWVSTGAQIHIFGHLSGDLILRDTLFQLGFGAVVAEQLRDLSPVRSADKVEIIDEKDISGLVELQVEHNRYYGASPIFLSKDTDRSMVRARLEEHQMAGDSFFVCYDQQEPSACFIVGSSPDQGEGYLLRNTGTAQIKSAYIKPQLRGQGIGKALLQRSIEWSVRQGFQRLFVEHETANFHGGMFWCRYFCPFVYFSMRYVGERE
jgi:GNAT superfamily N-acetyltransferase